MSFITEAALVKHTVLLIDDVEITSNYVYSTKITYDTKSFKIFGEIELSDELNFSLLIPLSGKNKVNITVMDLFDEYYTRDFVILSYEEEMKTDRQKAIKLKIQDKLSFVLDNTYVSKSFKDKKLSEVITAYWDEFQWDDKLTISDNVDKTINESTVVHKGYAVPENISFLKFVLNECKKEGLLFYQTRNECILESKEKLLPSALPDKEKPFTEMELKTSYIGYIHERSNRSNYGDNLNKTPKRKYTYYDYETKTYIDTEENLSDRHDDCKLATFDNSTLQEDHDQEGAQLMNYYLEDPDYIKSDVRDTFTTNNICSIYVSGNLKYNKVFEKIDLEIKGSASSKDMVEGDKRLKGKYVCTAISDRIIGNKLMQKLDLERIDFEEPK